MTSRRIAACGFGLVVVAGPLAACSSSGGGSLSGPSATSSSHHHHAGGKQSSSEGGSKSSAGAVTQPPVATTTQAPSKGFPGGTVVFSHVTQSEADRMAKKVDKLPGVQTLNYYPKTHQFKVFFTSEATDKDKARATRVVQRQTS